MISLLGALRPSNSGYQIANSVRLRSSASAYFSRTFSTPTSATIFTWSAWVKRGVLSGTYKLFGAGASFLAFNASDQLNLTINAVSAATSTAVFRDPSAWYHIVYAQNGASQTIYVNGNSVATGTTASALFNTAIVHQIGAGATTNFFDGYIAEVNFIDGLALTPTSFGEINAIKVWSPKAYAGAYGTNGSFLKFTDASGLTALTIGLDSSGMNNNWTPSGVSITAGVTYDSMIDTPTPYGDGTQYNRGNYAELSTLANTGQTGTTLTSKGTVFTIGTTGVWANLRSTFAVTSGRYYWEITSTTVNAVALFGICLATQQPKLSWANAGVYGYTYDGWSVSNGALSQYLDFGWYDSPTFGLLYDADLGVLDLYKNGEAYAQLAQDIPIGVPFCPAGFGQATSGSFNFGQHPFTYSIPNNCLALNTCNLSTSSVLMPSNGMAATLYTGTGVSLSVSNSSFQPDLVWIKARSAATDHALYDSVRGTGRDIASNLSSQEVNLAAGLTSFNETGFTVGALGKVNNLAATYVAWQWKANGAAVSNTDGSITSQVNANKTNGFSIVGYTGIGSNTTIGHGLGSAPELIIFKNRSVTQDWSVYHSQLTSAAYYLFLNSSAIQTSNATVFNSTAPDSSVFNVGTFGGTNGAGNSIIAYCFTEIEGFSKIDSYTGNGLVDGPFVYCGFRPKFILIKGITTAAESWSIIDTSRNPNNVSNSHLFPNLPAIEGGATLLVDILSNGFKIRVVGAGLNTNASKYVYAAFAETAFKYALAR